MYVSNVSISSISILQQCMLLIIGYAFLVEEPSRTSPVAKILLPFSRRRLNIWLSAKSPTKSSTYAPFHIGSAQLICLKETKKQMHGTHFGNKSPRFAHRQIENRYEDNVGCIGMSSNPVRCKSSRHLFSSAPQLRQYALLCQAPSLCLVVVMLSRQTKIYYGNLLSFRVLSFLTR